MSQKIKSSILQGSHRHNYPVALRPSLYHRMPAKSRAPPVNRRLEVFVGFVTIRLLGGLVPPDSRMQKGSSLNEGP